MVMSRPPWGHESRHCIYCGRVGPRMLVAGGYAHKYCLPEDELRREQYAVQKAKRAYQKQQKS